MKKKIQKLLCAALALTMVLALSACGESTPAVTQDGTWSLSQLQFVDIEQGKIAQSFNSTVTLFSDNTYMLSCVQNTYYSSDGGETFSPTYYANGVLYGTYEITNENAELGEKTLKFVSVTRIVVGDYDTSVSVTDADKDTFLTNSQLNGLEIILGSDGRMSAYVDTTTVIHGINSPE